MLLFVATTKKIPKYRTSFRVDGRMDRPQTTATVSIDPERMDLQKMSLR